MCKSRKIHVSPTGPLLGSVEQRNIFILEICQSKLIAGEPCPGKLDALEIRRRAARQAGFLKGIVVLAFRPSPPVRGAENIFRHPPSGSRRSPALKNAVQPQERNSWSRCLLASPSALQRALRRRLGSQLQTLLRRASRCSSSSVTFRWNRPRLSDASLLALRCSASAHSI